MSARHRELVVPHLHRIPVSELPPAAGLDISIHKHACLFDEDLGVAPGPSDAGELQELAESDPLIHLHGALVRHPFGLQSVSRIGMIR